MNKHSPEPWSQDPEGEVAYTIEDATGQPICDVFLTPDRGFTLTREEGEANTHLITAAPELLKALHAVKHHFEYSGGYNGEREKEHSQLLENQVINAITKAKGNTP